jgi:urocanate hydratase
LLPGEVIYIAMQVYAPWSSATTSARLNDRTKAKMTRAASRKSSARSCVAMFSIASAGIATLQAGAEMRPEHRDWGTAADEAVTAPHVVQVAVARYIYGYAVARYIYGYSP